MDRWDPFRDVMTFREAMDRWLQQSISGTGQLLSNMRSESIPVDVVESDDAFEVHAVVPGVKPEDVEVTVQGERVTVRAEVHAREEKHGDNWLIREQRSGTMQRTLTLPTPVSSENAEARIEHGVLTLRLPKAAGAKPHRINVATGSPSASSSVASQKVPGTESDVGQGGRDTTAEGDRVTEQSQESFPASDPPSWT
jgi:HSP20 family protein